MSRDSDLSQLSHKLSGQDRTMADSLDTPADPDLRIRILTHWPDGRH
jgi:hypothetical protein